ncbi:MAG: hypothetical protein Q8P72_04700 [Candidatus Roizmanbacteria bacterium]|nr:hypothetical protein [Candidatus Roizmanbacteria bacterium]
MNNTLPVPALYNSIIAKEVIMYKEQIKEMELITKVRIVRAVRKDHIPIGKVAEAFSCHRNTIANILSTFEKNFSEEDQTLLLNPHTHISQRELFTTYQCLLNTSRKPHGHKKAARLEDEEQVIRLFQEKKIRVGVKRMKTFLQRRYGDKGLGAVTTGQLKGIYKRNSLKIQKVRSSNGERRHLYDYQLLGCFEKMHYDVKHILDKHALPQEIYEIFSHKTIPKYEWNIIDAKSRVRFIAYSYELNSEFGLRFLLFVIQYIRSTLIAHDQPIVVGLDNGLEFCCGSTRKEKEWNQLLSCVNASVYSYEPRFDIRKNLIERSHLTDDEELYIPRGIYMKTKQTFIKEVTDYAYYWNFKRPHSGIEMHNRTPFEMIKQSGLLGGERLMQFPTLILDKVIDQLRQCNRTIEFEAFARTNPTVIKKTLTCQKTQRDIENRFFLPTNAQNVLTYYL